MRVLTEQCMDVAGGFFVFWFRFEHCASSDCYGYTFVKNEGWLKKTKNNNIFLKLCSSGSCGQAASSAKELTSL